MNQHWIIPGDNQLHESTGTHGAETQQNPLVKLDPGLFIWTILTFVLISTILAKFAWKPLLAMLEERNKSISAEDILISSLILPNKITNKGAKGIIPSSKNFNNFSN